MIRYQPQGLPRTIALLSALALTATVLVGVHHEAAPERPAPALTVVFTGEVTADGPVYRLPTLNVTAKQHFELALPGLIDRALGRSDDAGAKPSA